MSITLKGYRVSDMCDRAMYENVQKMDKLANVLINITRVCHVNKACVIRTSRTVGEGRGIGKAITTDAPASPPTNTTLLLGEAVRSESSCMHQDATEHQ